MSQDCLQSTSTSSPDLTSSGRNRSKSAMASLLKFPLLATAVFVVAASGSALEGPDADFAIPRELDQLLIPVSTLVGIPPSEDQLPSGVALSPSGISKRSPRRFRTSSSTDEYHVCTPSRHEVIRLLLALHEARQGRNMDRIIQLCNRHSNAAGIDTNIRFLG
ncbi:uncharacterized protein LOC119581092 [Penaeus monodon]|uniref:uncharacterized protein LOC119581092 n=1 Tax=Penaeus monodon TaxID=6687 RepID=UPI0018A7142F|nr:uncharacterized protein LOC119581092 [Penaeus monodon]